MNRISEKLKIENQIEVFVGYGSKALVKISHSKGLLCSCIVSFSWFYHSSSNNFLWKILQEVKGILPSRSLKIQVHIFVKYLTTVISVLQKSVQINILKWTKTKIYETVPPSAATNVSQASAFCNDEDTSDVWWTSFFTFPVGRTTLWSSVAATDDGKLSLHIEYFFHCS